MESPAAPAPSRSSARNGAVLWLLGGLMVLAMAWLWPVNLKSLNPALLEAAGEGTPGVVGVGRQWLEREKPGPAALALAAAERLESPGREELARELADFTARAPELAAWGGWDPFLDPLFKLEENAGRTASTPVLTFFIGREAREALRGFLANSRSLGVQAVVRTRELANTTRFVPAERPGGQALDAVILLTALLYQGEHLGAGLQREVRQLAESAWERREPAELEAFYLDVLALGQRLDWTQLTELFRRTGSVAAVAEIAQLARLAPEDLPLIYTAAVMAPSAEAVATYLMQFGRVGVEDLRLALESGQGAVRQLTARQVPVTRGGGPALAGVATFALLYPGLMLGLKYAGFFLGAWCLFRGLDRLVIDAPARSWWHLRGGALAALTAGLLVLGSEPFMLRAAPASEFQFKLVMPVLASVADGGVTERPVTFTAMDPKTLLSIAFFASLQVAMYLFCLLKIREIERQAVPSGVKLRLMENEENLFDGGLYLGIGGTAAALVFQVLGIIDANLLAAYSSNLFGIACVALIKIRHVRPYKRKLIMESLATATVPATVAVPSAS